MTLQERRIKVHKIFAKIINVSLLEQEEIVNNAVTRKHIEKDVYTNVIGLSKEKLRGVDSFHVTCDETNNLPENQEIRFSVRIIYNFQGKDYLVSRGIDLNEQF